MILKFLQKMVISVLFLLLFSLRFGNAINGEVEAPHLLERAWKATGLRLEAITVESWLQIDTRGRNKDELTVLSRQIRERMALGEEVEMTAGETGGVLYSSFSGIRTDSSVVTGTLYSAVEGGTQMGIYTVRRGKIKNMRSYLEGITSVLSEFGVDVDLAVLLEGSCAGSLSPTLVKDLTGKVLGELDGEWVETQWAPEGSVTKAYTAQLNEAVDRHSRAVNLIISTIYDEARDITEVTVATPVLKGVG